MSVLLATLPARQLRDTSLVKKLDSFTATKVAGNSSHDLSRGLSCSISVNSMRKDATELKVQSTKRIGGDGRVIDTTNIASSNSKRSKPKEAGVLERLKQKSTTLLTIRYSAEDVVMIASRDNLDLRKHDGRLAIVQHVNEYTVSVSLYKEKENVLVQPQFLEEVDPGDWAEVRAMHKRISQLQSCELDLAEDILLDFFSRRTCFTPKQKLLIERMEEDHGLADDFGSNAILWGQTGISIAVSIESQKVDQAPAAH